MPTLICFLHHARIGDATLKGETAAQAAGRAQGNGHWGRPLDLSFFASAAIMVLPLGWHVPKPPRMPSGQADHARHLLAGPRAGCCCAGPWVGAVGASGPAGAMRTKAL